MLKLGDIPKTTRRAKNGDGRTVFPRFQRDRSLAPRIDMAVRYLESMLGRPRRELDQEVIIQLFGDHKIARCVVACLAASYRHRPRLFVEVLPPELCGALAERGITSASELRLWIFRRVNRDGEGFVGVAGRLPFLQRAGAELGLTTAQLDLLMGLDQPANAILVRSGPAPSSDDVLARFNYETAAALLASAPEVSLRLKPALRDPALVRMLCDLARVEAAVTHETVTLRGQQDALGGWTRHGARVVRLITALLANGLPAQSGDATVAAPGGGTWRFHLDGATLDFLGATGHGSDSGALAGLETRLRGLLAAWLQSDSFAADFAAARRAGGMEGWLLRRAAEPVVTNEAVLPALFTCTRNGQRVTLVAAPVGAMGTMGTMGQLLDAASARYPLVALRIGDDAETDAAEGAVARVGETPTLMYRERQDLTRLPDLLTRAVGSVRRNRDDSQMAQVFKAAETTGVLTEQEIARLLGCAEDDIPGKFTSPAARAACWRHTLHYVEGFGLCSGEALSRIRDAASQVTDAEVEASLDAPRRVRLLGRRLREVTGASEGIECLIAYLGAA